MSEQFTEVFGGNGSGGGSGVVVRVANYAELISKQGSVSIIYITLDNSSQYYWDNIAKEYKPVNATIPSGSVPNSALQIGNQYSVKGTVDGTIVDITQEEFKDYANLSTKEIIDSLASLQSKTIPIITKDSKIFYRDVIIEGTDSVDTTTIYGKILHKFSNAIGTFHTSGVFNLNYNAPELFTVNDITVTSSGFISLVVNNTSPTTINLKITIN